MKRLVLPTVALAVAFAAAFQPAGGQSVPPPLPAGPAPDLDIVVTAQVAGWIDPCG